MEGGRSKTAKLPWQALGSFRVYVDGGHFDTFPYDLTVTDDYEQVDTTPGSLIGCPSGSDRLLSTSSITDPNRYTGGPDLTILIDYPHQRPDGSWLCRSIFGTFIPATIISYRRIIPTAGDVRACLDNTSTG